MNIIAWIRENAGMFQVTAARDPEDYNVVYEGACAAVDWRVGDELYKLDVDFRNFKVKAETCHERAPSSPIREIELPFYTVVGEHVEMAVQLKACADAHLEKAKECARHSNVSGHIWCNKVGNLLYSILQGRGWATIVP